jgi:hypothetical protein
MLNTTTIKALLVLAAAAGIASSANAGIITWTGTTNTSWATAGNWSGGTPDNVTPPANHL